MIVVGDAGGDRPALQPEAPEKGPADVAGLVVPFHDGDVQDVPVGVGRHVAIHHGEGGLVALGYGHPGEGAHEADGRLPRPRFGPYDQVPGGRGRPQVEGARRDRGALRDHEGIGQLPALGDGLAPGYGPQHPKVLRAAHDVDVGVAAGREGADLPLHVEGAGGVEGDYLDGRHEAHALGERDPSEVVQVPVVDQGDGAGVVRDQAQETGVHAALGGGPDELGQGRHDQVVAQVGVDAVSHPEEDVLEIQRLVVVGDAGRRERAPRGAPGLRAVADEGLPRPSGGVHGGQKVLVARDDVVRHHLREPDRVLALQGGGDDASVEEPPAGLKPRRERHVRGDHEVELQRRPPRLLEGRVYGLHPADDPDLVKVGEHAGRAARQDRLREARHAQGAALGVDVPLDEARHDVAVARLDDLGALPDRVPHVADGRDALARHRDSAGVDLARVDVDQALPADDEVRLLPTQSDREQPLVQRHPPLRARSNRVRAALYTCPRRGVRSPVGALGRDFTPSRGGPPYEWRDSLVRRC